MTERTSAAPDSSGKEGGHQRSCRYHIFVIGCEGVGGMHHSGSGCHIPVIGAPIIGPIIRVPAAFSLAPSLFCHIVIILANINILSIYHPNFQKMGILLLLFRHRIVSYVVGLNYEIRPCAKAWALGPRPWVPQARRTKLSMSKGSELGSGVWGQDVRGLEGLALGIATYGLFSFFSYERMARANLPKKITKLVRRISHSLNSQNMLPNIIRISGGVL